MEKHFNQHSSVRHQQSKILAGVFIIAFGVIYLLEKAGVNTPSWLLSWETILIAIGTVMLFKHRWNTFAGWVLIAIGGIFMINDFRPNTLDPKFILPVLVISFGVIMVAKATNLFKKKGPQNVNIFDDEVDITSDDFISATTFFGGVTKNVVSKNFQGGDFTTTFGGTEINLTQADIQKPVTINANTTFGGIVLIVPSNWQVNSEVVTIFGGIDDKRPSMASSERDPNKVLTLKGNCLFGGVEIQSYI